MFFLRVRLLVDIQEPLSSLASSNSSSRWCATLLAFLRIVSNVISRINFDTTSKCHDSFSSFRSSARRVSAKLCFKLNFSAIRTYLSLARRHLACLFYLAESCNRLRKIFFVLSPADCSDHVVPPTVFKSCLFMLLYWRHLLVNCLSGNMLIFEFVDSADRRDRPLIVRSSLIGRRSIFFFLTIFSALPSRLFGDFSYLGSLFF